ncbi:MAG: tetraprenyl-beta-curcumene synthase family protein [Bacillota bacterium]|uniref:tetraprenyl-beta-curcumene synthase family protein n=1 Tax=Virgibacillus salarius TaxID=447199 RepID=UPI0024936DD5|nr:tetraprenyl-beta-curcumene synthase family protein [Virgibacillus salarius]WBX78852.1 tetraprenyl-beta-curcumene synthase family protein [Virgibacillus salarius]
MSNHVPNNPIILMATVYLKIFPAVRKELVYWQKRAAEIPDQELRTQALSSISSKRFHCQGGAVYSILAHQNWQKAVRFIVAYQTISDYLDNLCDRSNSMDPENFRLLHHAMIDALSCNDSKTDYYKYFESKDDKGYLKELVRTCNEALASLNHIDLFQEHALKLAKLYMDLQVHKHVIMEERIPRLTKWSENMNAYPLSWYEFSAAAGSTLGIYCLACYGFAGRLSSDRASRLVSGYFPYIQCLHILLDYYIDQVEDKEEEDLNFCNYYPDQITMQERFRHFLLEAHVNSTMLPDAPFHQMVLQGLVGLYLGDEKVKLIDGSRQMKRQLLKASGVASKFFHWNTRSYYYLKRLVTSSRQD